MARCPHRPKQSRKIITTKYVALFPPCPSPKPPCILLEIRDSEEMVLDVENSLMSPGGWCPVTPYEICRTQVYKFDFQNLVYRRMRPLLHNSCYLALYSCEEHNVQNTQRRFAMTLCPIALAVGCKKCPLVKICPAKTIIGDYKKEDPGDKKG